MNYPTYQKPNIAGVTMASGGFAQQAIYDGVLSYEADAQPYATAIGAKLVNARTTPATNLTFVGIRDTDTAQPWMVTWDDVNFYFAGIAVDQQIGATYNLIGSMTTAYPGTWAKQSSGVWLFTPQPLTPVVVPPVVANPADVAGWLAAMNVPTVTLQQIAAAIAYGFAQLGVKVPPQ